ncbi:hypothetical protein JB92DRAFT_3145175 [Gautieria morchelliformis]|nr:hypothetical protein JB92DRAFT_3145175 [Gautieria morchelliformis]
MKQLSNLKNLEIPALNALDLFNSRDIAADYLFLWLSHAASLPKLDHLNGSGAVPHLEPHLADPCGHFPVPVPTLPTPSGPSTPPRASCAAPLPPPPPRAASRRTTPRSVPARTHPAVPRRDVLAEERMPCRRIRSVTRHLILSLAGVSPVI